MSVKIIRSVESRLDRLSGRGMNPLPQAGALTFLLCVTLLVSGATLFTYYSVDPEDVYLSIKYVTDETLVGFVMRGVHRHAADLILALAAAHMLRAFFLGWGTGPRRMSWISGVALLFFLIYQGITGYILPWDERSQTIIQSLSGAVSYIPFAGEPLSRYFLLNGGVTTRTMIFILASHLVPPVVALGLFWFHFRRVHRPRVWPNARLTMAVLAGLGLAAALVPADSLRPVDFSRIAGAAPFDWAHLFPATLISAVGPALFWPLAAGVFAVLAAAPIFAAMENNRSVVGLLEDNCVGCALCEADCPYMAMDMEARPLRSRYPWLVRVMEDRCVGCGVCVGSCGFGALSVQSGADADSRVRAREFLLSRKEAKPVIVYACKNVLNDDSNGASGAQAFIKDESVFLTHLVCAGELYTGWIEEDLKNGAAGVVVARCSPWRCQGREGAAFAEARIFHDRKPWMRRRVGHDKVRLVTCDTDTATEDISAAIRSLRGEGGDAGVEKNEANRGYAFSVAVCAAVFLFAFSADTLWRYFPYPSGGGQTGRVTVSVDCKPPCKLELSAGGETLFEKSYNAAGEDGVVKIVEKIDTHPGSRDVTVTLTDSKTGRSIKTEIAGPIEAGQVIVVRENANTGSLEAIYDPRKG